MNNEHPIYPVSLTIRIDWSELDMFKHVNNVSYFKYIQASRVNYWEQVGLADMHQQLAIAPVLLSTQCRFIKPLFYPGSLTIKASIDYLKNSSFGIKHQLFNANNELAAEAADVVVLLDEATGSKVNIPATIRTKVMQLEGLV
ncbi:MAG: acyl-CoA thioesterase [Bacteroidetes bacterium]|nr:MAG: acyl-CoA thioesterase [Bacteroidota bacterium]